MQPRCAKGFPETLVSLQSPSSCRLYWRIGTGRSCPTLRHASTIAQQWLHLNDYCRGNPDRRPVGSADQTDDRFVAMSSKVCNSAMSSKPVDVLRRIKARFMPIADRRTHAAIAPRTYGGSNAHFAKQIYPSNNLCRKPSFRLMSYKLTCTSASCLLLSRW